MGNIFYTFNSSKTYPKKVNGYKKGLLSTDQ